MISGNQAQVKNNDSELVLLDSKQKPAWHIAVLSIFSLGIYNIYWLYFNLRNLTDSAIHLKAQMENSSAEELRIMGRLKEAGTLDALFAFCVARPVLTTFLFAVPLLNLLVLLGFANAAAKLNPQQGFARNNPAFAAFLIALFFGALSLLSKLPEPYQLLYTLSCLPLATVQHWLNNHWKVVEKDEQRLARQAFNVPELALIIVGAMVLGLNYVHSEMHL